MGDQTFMIHVMIIIMTYFDVYKFYPYYSSGANYRFYVK